MSRSWLEIDEAAVTRNTRTMLTAAGGASLCAVVKANGYGHGSVPVARAALAGGATVLAVAQVLEGIQLRQERIDAPIWILSQPEAREMTAAVSFGLEPSLQDATGIEAMVEAVLYEAKMAKQASLDSKPAATVHVCVDTGMHRSGAQPEDVLDLVAQIAATDALTLGSVWTHCASADEPDNPLTNQQMDRFDQVLLALDQADLTPPMVHAANSGATLAFPRTHRDIVRCGISLYGLSPSPELAGRVELEPAMRWLTRVALLKRLDAGDRVGYGQRGLIEKATTVATLPVGYADGYRRATWQVPGSVLIGGKRRSLVGVVTMDQIVVDVGDDDIAIGDEAVLLGRQGEASISAGDLAQGLDTINYEIVCSPSARVRRVYLPD